VKLTAARHRACARCTVLPRVALCSTALHCVALWSVHTCGASETDCCKASRAHARCSVLQCVAACCTVLQCVLYVYVAQVTLNAAGHLVYVRARPRALCSLSVCLSICLSAVSQSVSPSDIQSLMTIDLYMHISRS